jgi:hypothetical protein
VILAIDPGISGAIAALTANNLAWVVDMPVRPREGGGKIRNEVDPRALQANLRKLVPADDKAIVVMESQHAFVGGDKREGSMASQASLAATKATICTVCELTGFDITLVTPKTWQKFFGIANRPGETTKKQSLRIARELFGRELCPLEKHDGRADALLIARWALRNLT